MKKKIGIVSIYGNYNFGNKLQNYAIQKKCKDLGFESEIIKNKNVKTTILKNIVCEKLLKRWYRNKKFWEFEKKFLKTTNNYVYGFEDNKNINNKFEYFIVGSDQVWNPDFGLKGNLEFLEFVKDKKTIAFSASFGVDTIEKKLYSKYINGLNKLNYISVRENEGKKIVENLTKRKDVEVLVDPTMLLTRDEWRKVSKKPKSLDNDKYILNYFLGDLSKERKQIIEEFAYGKGWKIINILDKNDPFYECGPSEFIYLEEHAELICTDSFHSCVFAILMNTPFIVFNREDKDLPMNSRIDTLLSKFELEDRRYANKLTDECLKNTYINSYKILEEERKKSEKFLKNALNIKK